MKITCQSCQSKYTVSDDKVQGKTVKIKCRKCGATIVVNSSGATTGGDAAPASQSGAQQATEGGYLVNVNDGDQRSMSLAEVLNAFHQGIVNADTYVWADGMTDWQPLSQVDAVMSQVGGGAALPPPAASTPPPRASTPAPPAAASQSEPPRAARRDAGRGRGADLFGGGGGLQAATEDPRPNASLFNGSGTPAPSPSMTGQREENSVLFSLSALTAKAPATASSPGKTTATKDDSGLIDLKALAASAAPGAPPAQQPQLVPDQVGGLFPLGAPPPSPIVASAGSPMSIAPAANNNKTTIFIALGAVIAVAAIVSAFFIAKGSGTPPAPSIVYVTASAPEPAAPTVTATAAPTATETAVASAAPTSSAVAKAGSNHGGGTTAKNGGGTTAKNGGNSAPPPKPLDNGSKPPPSSKGSCGCAAGDLMCAMNCSAKGH